MIQTKIICDTCWYESYNTNTTSKIHNKKINNKKLQVIFQTEQDEGRRVKDYLDTVDIDICDSCMSKILLWNYIFAKWGQWYNSYSFIKFF